MKFTVSAVLLAIGALSDAEANLSMRGNTNAASKLMKLARRLDYQYGGDYQGNYGNNNAANNYDGQQQQQQYQGQYGEQQQQGQQQEEGAAENNDYNYNNNGEGQEDGNAQQQGDGYNYNYNYNYNNGEQEGQQEEAEEDDSSFLVNYSINLLSCIDGEMVRSANDENGYENSAVMFRLCPADTCGSSDMGCDEGYGDYVIGLNTFMELYLENFREQYEGNDGGENNNGYNGYNANPMIAYNAFGATFDGSEYLQCAEYDPQEAMEEAQEMMQNYYQYNQYGGQYGQNYQYNNQEGQQQGGYYMYGDVQFFIGPGCSSDGTTIGLKLYMNEDCTYPASSDIDFATLSYGLWDEGIPFEDGGLVSMNCVSCYGQNEDGEYEENEFCENMYESTSTRCEDNMDIYSNYGQNNYYNNQQQQQQQQQQQYAQNGYYYNGNQNSCEYTDSLLSTVYSTSYVEDVVETVKEAYDMKDSTFVAITVIFVLLCAAATVALYKVFIDGRKTEEDTDAKYVSADDDNSEIVTVKSKIAEAESIMKDVVGKTMSGASSIAKSVAKSISGKSQKSSKEASEKVEAFVNVTEDEDGASKKFDNDDEDSEKPVDKATFT